VVQIEQISAHLKGLGKRIVMSSGMSSGPWSLAPVAYSHISNIRRDGTLSIRNFIMMLKIFKNHNFEPILAYVHDPAKVPKFQNWA
jgi:hypothetical protein